MKHTVMPLSAHQLLLEPCPTGCTWRGEDVQHWHEGCQCGVEYVLSHDAEHTSQIVLVAVYDHDAESHGW